MAEQNKPARPKATATPTATAGGKPQSGAPSPDRPYSTEEREHDQEHDEENTPTEEPAAPKPGTMGKPPTLPSKGHAAPADDLPAGGLVLDLCSQSMHWHIMALRRILSVEPGDLADVLRNLADWLEDPTEE